MATGLLGDMSMTAIGIIILLIIVAISGWALYFIRKMNVKEKIPYADKVLKAAQKNLCVLILNRPSSNVCDAYVGKRGDNGEPMFDIPEIGLHFNPEHSGRTKPLRLGGVDFYLGSYINPECYSPDDVMTLNKLHAVREQYPNLRGFTNQDLHAFLIQPRNHWRNNCEAILTRYKEEHPGIPLENIPQDVDDFVETLTRAHNTWLHEAVDADYLCTTYESVKIRRRLMNKGGLFGKKRSTQAVNSDEDATALKADPDFKDLDYEYKFENAKRIPAAIKLYSLYDAQMTDSAAMSCADLEKYGLQVEIKVRKSLKDQLKDNIKQYAPIGITVMMILIGLGLCIYFIGMNK